MLVVSARLRSYRWVERYKYLLGTAGLLLLAITIIFGREVGGAKAWLRIGSWQFEPVEIVKVLLVLFLAGYLQENASLAFSRFSPFQQQGQCCFCGDFPCCLLQRDLGAALLLIGIFTIMLYLAAGQGMLVGASLLFCGIAAVLSTLLFHTSALELKSGSIPGINFPVQATKSGKPCLL